MFYLCKVMALAVRIRYMCRQSMKLERSVLMSRDTHIMLFEVPIMLRSNSQHQANYAHCFVPTMLKISNILHN